jgi:hypothetical protein
VSKGFRDAQRSFAAHAPRWQYDTNVDYRMAYGHFFGAKKKAT